MPNIALEEPTRVLITNSLGWWRVCADDYTSTCPLYHRRAYTAPFWNCGLEALTPKTASLIPAIESPVKKNERFSDGTSGSRTERYSVGLTR